MKKLFKLAFFILFVLSIIGMICVVFLLNTIIKEAGEVNLDKFKLYSPTAKITVYDKDENLIIPKLNLTNKSITLNDLNQHTIDAFISIEDKNFYNHKGLDYKRMIKAMMNNIASGNFKEGASTISQQLVKNTHLSNEKTIERKLKEIFITKKLEREFTKEEILELYLNIIYFGEGTYGIEQASNIYFEKSAEKLTLSESAILAGLIKSPATYSPVYHLEECLNRRDIVLKQMRKYNKISEEEYNIAMSETPVVATSKVDNTPTVDDFMFYDYYKNAVYEASQILNLSEEEIKSGEYKIFTYLDSDIQTTLHKAIINENHYHKNQYDNVADGLVVAIENKNNTIVAFAGNSKYNLVNLKRQPGSAIKPILVYAPAIEEGKISPMTKILDEKINIDGYTPNNVGNVFSGYTSVRDAVAKSLNIPAIKIMQEMGIENCKSFAKKCGIEFDKKDNGYAIALGGFTEGIGLTELTNSFTPFINNGLYKNASSIKEIRNKYGIVVYRDCRTENKVMGEDTAFLTTSLLRDGVLNGTSKKLASLDFDIAGKTGTVSLKHSNQNTDAISVAYTSEYSIGSWLGNYSLKTKYNLEGSNNGGTFATEILKECFSNIYKTYKPDKFKIPDSVQKVNINSLEYNNNNEIKIAEENCPERYVLTDYFSKRYLPTKVSNILYTNEEKLLVNYSKETNEATITINPKDYISYSLYRIDGNGKEHILDTFSNKKEKYEFVDKHLDYDSKYKYYVKYKINGVNKDSITDKITIYTNNKKTAQKPTKRNYAFDAKKFESWYFA